ncbi:I78 family peptidase inhibitor [Bordetella sp. FB-8]|uniref:I78 family peptidase inhibitor n=1 Tax=Bordetella sp. FB-8 TaxID=1159870 RepID=UPI0005255E88|nr:I78 family peptidase inhibitor [Bordetella sp. FB-8]
MAFRLPSLLAPLALTALLGGCAAPGASGSSASVAGPSSPSGSGTSYTPMSSDSPSSDCDSDRVQNMLGQTYSDGTGESVRRRSGSRAIRLLEPGQVMTMEYDPYRINIILDGKGAIQALHCG